ncbi:hypothetical protein [Algibacter sp. L1A34]|uniref:hypothetical protein n=1 Tax=Algibacter sp. L1A34 TaxID=2686365 RepID=UPI00131C2376|nr:hypothetical protein [Algibacter sp. L1A34]
MNQNLPINLFCSSFGHNYFLIERTSFEMPQLICKSCGTQFNYNTNGDIIKAKTNYTNLDEIIRILRPN